MPAVIRKMADLKDLVLRKIDKKFRGFRPDFIINIKNQRKNENSEANGAEKSKWEELESTKVVLQQHVKKPQKQMIVLQSEIEELEKYGRRLCIRVEGVPATDNETSEEVRWLINETECYIPKAVIDRAHCIGNSYKDRKTNTFCKSIIVRFSNFGHCTLFYQNRSKLKNNAKVKL